MSDISGFESNAAEAAEIIKAAGNVLVVAHIDADGITSAAIASTALDRAKIKNEVRFLKKLSLDDLQSIQCEDYDLFWFVDLGSGLFSKMNEKCIVSDHHRPDPVMSERHVNPHLYGIDGSMEVSGSGVTYAVAKAMGDNKDLSAIAVVGAIGDFQESSCSKLIGYNTKIVEDAVKYAGLKVEVDIRTFGKQTRPMTALFQYATDPKVIDCINPGHADDREACIQFLTDLGVYREGKTRYWYELSRDEKSKVVTAIVNRMIDYGYGIPHVRRMIGETYTLPENLVNTPPGWLNGLQNYDRNNARALFDAKEFSTLLNACGRHGLPDVGMRVCKGNRDKDLLCAMGRQTEHKESLKAAIELVKSGAENGIKCEVSGTALKNIRFFNGGNLIKDTILGTITGMLLNSPEVKCSDKPLIAFADSSDDAGFIKVSGRGTKELVDRGLDLSIAMIESSKECGGSGGGHNIAAGAALPHGKENAFLLKLDKVIGRQINAE